VSPHIPRPVRKQYEDILADLLDAHATVEECHEVRHLVRSLMEDDRSRHGPAHGRAAAEESRPDSNSVGKVVNLRCQQT